MKNKKKVLLIGPMPPPPGGVSIHLMRLLMKSAHHPEFKLAVLDLNKRKLYRDDGTTAGVLNAILFFFSADIIHIHLSHSVKVLIARIGKMFGKKVVYTQHNKRELNESSTRKIIALADETIYVFGEKGGANVVPAYIPSNDKRPLPEKLEAILNEYEHIIVTSGSSPSSAINSADIYGFNLVLDAIDSLPSLKNTAVVFLDTNNTYRIRYENRIRAIEKEKGVLIIYTNEDLNFSALMGQHTIYIRATLTDGDSISVREGLQASAIVIASDCVNRPEGCLLFRMGDAADLSLKIGLALQIKSGKCFEQDDFSERIFSIYRAFSS